MTLSERIKSFEECLQGLMEAGVRDLLWPNSSEEDLTIGDFLVLAYRLKLREGITSVPVDDDAFDTGFRNAHVETWQEEMARYKRDPEALRQRKEDGLAVGRMLQDQGVDLPIVMPNPDYPVGDQIGREARLFTKEMKDRWPGLDVGPVDPNTEWH